MNDQFKTDCLAIMALALETPKAKADIMIDWAAHCQFFSVRVYMGGWKSSTSPSLSAECHNLDAKNHTPDYHTDPAKVLEQIKALLA